MYPAKVIANWFLGRAERLGKTLTHMQLQKLVYIAHGWHMAILDEELIAEDVQAWKWGPVIPSLYEEFCFAKSEGIRYFSKTYNFPFKHETVEILEKVWDVYGQLDGLQLSALTHRSNTPWSRFFEDGVRDIVIPNQDIMMHYREMAAREHGTKRSAI